jgi:hypothetical protein
MSSVVTNDDKDDIQTQRLTFCPLISDFCFSFLISSAIEF